MPGAPDADSAYRAHINEALASEGLTYERGVTNKNFLWLLVEDYGLDELRKQVKSPLEASRRAVLRLLRAAASTASATTSGRSATSTSSG